MRSLFIPVVALGMVVSGASFAQSSTSSSQQGSPADNPALLTPQKLQQDLQNAGFTDVRVTEEAFLVQARTKDGNPVVMSIGPNGFSAMEAIYGNGPSIGSTSNSSSGASGTQK